jgi:phospholipid/cholesterol/gamma-HCH transport system substrate-binding protein
MRESLFETLVGFVVVAVAGFFLFFSLSQGTASASGDSYSLTAKFRRADGITPGTDVRMSGVKIGAVTDVRYNPETFKAEVKLHVQKGTIIPSDSSAQVQSDSLLGGNYLNIEPGGESTDLATDGSGEFQYVQDSVPILRVLIDAVTAASGGGNTSGSEEESTP